MAEDDWAPMLSAVWVNARVKNVYDRSIEILEKILEQIIDSGYLPFEKPLPEELDERLTPEQKVALGLEEPPLEDQLAFPS